MKRRDFLKGAGAAGFGLLVVGGHCSRKLHARSELEGELVGEAKPVLTRKALAELRELPAKGREAIRIWFHGPCLNAAAFAVAVTSDDFRQRIADCATAEEQRLEFLLAFNTHIVPADEIMRRVRLIAEELGSELDLNWEECCNTMSQQWGVHVRSYGSSLPEGLSASLEPLIRTGLEESLAVARTAGQRPALQQTTGKIGESALQFLPLVPISPAIVIPVFVAVSAGHLYSYFVGLWNKGRSIDFIRKAVSARIALLANRIGDEFAAEMRLAIGRLHTWQEQAVRVAASAHAEEAVPIF